MNNVFAQCLSGGVSLCSLLSCLLVVCLFYYLFVCFLKGQGEGWGWEWWK